jgi:hypothetical protein
MGLRLVHYILVGQTVVPEPDLLKWALWYETGDRVVKQTTVGATLISTVFLGLDHNFGDGPPLLFETMTFTDGEDNDCERCSTWLQAEAQHERFVEAEESRFNVMRQPYVPDTP